MTPPVSHWGVKKKGEKLPSIEIEGKSEAKFVFKDGKIVKVTDDDEA